MSSRVWFAPVDQKPSPDALAETVVRVARAAGMNDVIPDGGLVGILQHVGEGENVGHLPPAVTAAVAGEIKTAGGKPFLTGSATLYKGSRKNAPDHIEQACAHGFTPDAAGCPIVMCDGLVGSDRVEVDVKGAKHHPRAFLGSAAAFMKAMIVVTHPTGHMLSGFGAAIKNVSMGLSARSGKLAMHHGGRPEFVADKCTACGTCAEWCPEDAIAVGEIAVADDAKCVGCGQCFTVCPDDAINFQWAQSGLNFQERLVDYAAAADTLLKDRIFYISVVRHFQAQCDCWNQKEPPLCPDVGVLASTDIVAIDRATADLVNKAGGKDVIKEAWNFDYEGMFAYAEGMGLGSVKYTLQEVTSDQ